MQLSLEQIRQITCGAVEVLEEKKGIRFYRFTREQMELYAIKNRDFYMKALSTAGITLSFRTDSRKLGLKMLIEQLIGRQFFSVDVYINGKPVGYLDNFDPAQMPRDYVAVEAPSGQFQKEFDLGEGAKTVTVFLPWNKKLTLQSMTLDDGAMLEPVKPEKKILFFGDSITQGYDAQRPAHRYAGQIARALGAEEFNKAIGGECICPELVAARDNLDPDYILVAYGTNDWSKTDPETFTTNSKAFYAALAENYPQAKVFTLTPIWRSNLTTLNSKFDDFGQVETIIREVTAPYENVTVVRGFEFVPHDINCFSDYGLHPNDTGFDHYFEKLGKAIL